VSGEESISQACPRVKGINRLSPNCQKWDGLGSFRVNPAKPTCGKDTIMLNLARGVRTRRKKMDDIIFSGTFNSSTGIFSATSTVSYAYGWPLAIIILLLTLLVCLSLFRN